MKFPQRVLMGLVKGYRLLVSPALGKTCIYEPSCSEYSLQALERHGAIVGIYLTMARIARCHPWCQGGCDEVPQRKPFPFNRFGTSSSAKSEKTPS